MNLNRSTSRPSVSSSLHGISSSPAMEDRLRFPLNERPGGGLPELMQLLLRHKGRLLAAAVAGTCLGLCLCLLSPSSYQARVALEIQNPNADFLDARFVNSVAEASAADSGSLTDVATELKIIESDQLLDRVIAKLQAEGQAGPLEAAAARPSFVKRLRGGRPYMADVLASRMREMARKSLSVKQVGPTRAVEILYSSTDPVFAARFANTLALQYIDRSEEARWSKSRRTEESLSHELAEVRSHLQASQNALQQYAANSGLLFVNGQHAAADSGDLSERKLSELQSALSQAEQQRVTAQSRYESSRSAAPEDIGDVLSDPQLRELKAKLTDLRRQKAELATTYTDESDKVRRITAQIAPLEADFQQQLSSIQNRISEDYGMAKREEYLLRVAYNEQVRVVEGKEGDTVQYSILRQDVDSNEKLYDSVLEQVKRAGIASAVRSNNIEIFDPAKPPMVPTAPRPALMAGVGLIGGLLAAALFTFFTESSDRRLQVAGELQQQLQLRELGVIPASQPGKLLGMGAKEPKSPMELITWSKPRSIEDEAYRALLTSILYSDELGPAPKTIVLTSANPGEGKTTTGCNLGILMAELDQRVLLIDADLRRPRLHQIFRASARGGLTDLLSDDNPLDPKDFVQPTFVPNLFLLSSGEGNPSPAKLLHSGRLRTLLQKLRNDFDLILIDTSPSLLTADARILGRSADAVVLVTRVGFTTCGEVEAVAQVFAADGTRLLGTVLNDAKSPRSNYHYYAASA